MKEISSDEINEFISSFYKLSIQTLFRRVYGTGGNGEGDF